MLRGRTMTIGSKFNVGLSNITIDRLTLLSYKIKLKRTIFGKKTS